MAEVAAAAAAAAPRARTGPPSGGDFETPAAEKREIGRLAVWSVTTAKPGNGVELLRDDCTDTYWQSDGVQPHLVSIQFQRKVPILELALFCDFKHDESYTPKLVSVRAGNGPHDLKEVRQADLHEPAGWVHISLRQGDVATGEPLHAYFVQLAILSNHQNGRDSHVRQVHVFGPQPSVVHMYGHPLQFTSVEFSQYAVVR